MEIVIQMNITLNFCSSFHKSFFHVIVFEPLQSTKLCNLKKLFCMVVVALYILISVNLAWNRRLCKHSSFFVNNWKSQGLFNATAVTKKAMNVGHI